MYEYYDKISLLDTRVRMRWHMINKWLYEEMRELDTDKFQVIDLKEVDDISQEVKEYIANHLISSFRNIEQLKFRYKDRDKEELRKYIKEKIFPNQDNQFSKNVKQGDWGEVLSAIILNDIKSVILPITKLRWKINNEKSMFGTDVFAIRENEEELQELIYCEVKTKITYDKEIGIKAYESLYRDNGSSLPDIIDFISKVYFEKGDYELAAKYDKIYLNMDNHTKEFQIFLIMDGSIWRDEIVDILKASSVDLERLFINIVLIPNFKDLIEETYELTADIGEKLVYGE